MPKLDLSKAPVLTGSRYPSPMTCPAANATG